MAAERLPLPPDVEADLTAIVGGPHVVTDPAARAPHETDWTGRFAGTTPAVIRPGDADEVTAIVATCRRHGVAVVPQGGNTGLVAGATPLGGEVVVDLRRLAHVGAVDPVSGQITAGAGATLAAVQAAARAAGQRYAVDFAARDSATIGGTIATNAGGVHVVRWGATRQQCVGIDAVLGTGSRVTSMAGLTKDNTGYHLPSLLCGSEGTLGIVTAARLALVPTPAHRIAALVGFATVADAVGAVAALRAELDGLEAAELVLADGLALVGAAFGLPAPFARPWPAALLVEAAGPTDPTAALGAAVDAAPGAMEAIVAESAERRAALWRYREGHTLAINGLGPPHKLDVAVALGDLASFLTAVPAAVAAVAPGARTWLFGHAGDGNVHVNVTGVDPDDDAVDGAVLELVAELGGSISAEHGIGRAKRRWLHLTRSTEEIAAMVAIKRALDPDGILNPGTLLPAG